MKHIKIYANHERSISLASYLKSSYLLVTRLLFALQKDLSFSLQMSICQTENGSTKLFTCKARYKLCLHVSPVVALAQVSNHTGNYRRNLFQNKNFYLLNPCKKLQKYIPESMVVILRYHKETVAILQE